MRRREFLAGALAVGAVSANSMAGTAGQKDGPKREYYELRRYRMLPGAKKKLLNNFLRDAAIPAMNRIGIEPVGVFSVMFGPDSLTLYVLMPHKSLESVVQATSLIAADAEYQKAGASLLNSTMSEPAYVRVDSSLMLAFEQMPKLELPAAAAEKKSRIFELRTYESHSVKAARKKIEMFNDGGEIAIFRKTGLQPVFFGETLIGPNLPNLTYMVVFDNMAERDKRWDVFREDPAWKELRVNAAYKDTVSAITSIILRPASYSQI